MAKGKKQHDIFKRREAELTARVAELEAAAAAAGSNGADAAPAAAAAPSSALQEEVEELRAKLEKVRREPGCPLYPAADRRSAHCPT